MTEVIMNNFEQSTVVTASNDMLSDRIYTENFEIVLNQSLQDIYDLMSSLPTQSSETQHQDRNSQKEESKSLDVLVGSHAPIEAQQLVMFKTPIELRNLRDLTIPL